MLYELIETELEIDFWNRESKVLASNWEEYKC